MKHGSSRSIPDNAPKADLSHLKHLGRYLKPYKRQIAFAVLALIFTSSAVLGMGSGLRFLVDEGLGKGNHSLLNHAFIIMVCVVLLLAGATFMRFSLVTWIGEKVVADIRRDVFQHIIRMHLGFFETTRTGEILSRMTSDTTILQSVVGSSVSIALRNTLLFVGGAFMLFVTSPILTFYTAFIVPLAVAPIIILGRKVRKLSRASQDRLADLSSRIEESVSGIRAIQALSLESRETNRFETDIADLLVTAQERIRYRAALTAIVITLVFGAIITVLWIGGHSVLNGTLSAGSLSAFIFYSVVVAGAVGAISEVIGDLQRAAGSTERLMELLNLKSQITAPASPLILPTPLQGNVAFQDVGFHYPSRPDRNALEAFNLSITPGEHVAIVGPSGAGKTTLFQLLLRFYDPQSGHVFLDGIPIEKLDPVALRTHIGLVPQDPMIFSTNAWDNIRCGNMSASDSDVLKAAEAACALEFLMKLPQGLDSHLGEKGVRLSGGQRQRIAIARAIVRNPRILLLDEATNALDAESEHLVQQALTTLMKNRTTLVIAHRLSTVLNADRIVLMDQGKISAMGKHHELLKTSPLYARLAALQFEQKLDALAS